MAVVNSLLNAGFSERLINRAGAKKVNGRKRHIAVDITGVVLDVVITAPLSKTGWPPGRFCGTTTAPAAVSA